MGWAGDAQVFAKTVCFNYRAEKFFEKWLRDVRAEQLESGGIPDAVPNFWLMPRSSTAWGDVITVISWQVYQMYGNTGVPEDNFDVMKKRFDFMAQDTPYGSCRCITDEDSIASAFYAHSALLPVKAGKVPGRDMSEYERLYESHTGCML